MAVPWVVMIFKDFFGVQLFWRYIYINWHTQTDVRKDGLNNKGTDGQNGTQYPPQLLFFTVEENKRPVLLLRYNY